MLNKIKHQPRSSTRDIVSKNGYSDCLYLSLYKNTFQYKEDTPIQQRMTSVDNQQKK